MIYLALKKKKKRRRENSIFDTIANVISGFCNNYSFLIIEQLEICNSGLEMKKVNTSFNTKVTKCQMTPSIAYLKQSANIVCIRE